MHGPPGEQAVGNEYWEEWDGFVLKGLQGQVEGSVL